MIGRLIEAATALPRPMRFVIAGSVAAGTNWLVRFPLSEVMPFLPAVLLAAIIGLLVGFAAYRVYVFPGSQRPLELQIRDFLIVNGASMVLMAAVALLSRPLFLHLTTLPIAEAAAHASGIAAGAVTNYIGHSLVTFRAKRHA